MKVETQRSIGHRVTKTQSNFTSEKNRVSVSLCLCGLILSVSLLCSVSAQAQSIAWPAEFPPRPLPARSVNFPSYQTQTLPNGLQVMASDWAISFS